MSYIQDCWREWPHQRYDYSVETIRQFQSVHFETTLCFLQTCSLSHRLWQEQTSPRLAAIDREVQGVQVFPQRLLSGEWFLTVEYAYRRMGAIRVVREDNYRTVVRQSDDSKADSAVALLHDERVIRGPQRVSTRVMVEWLGNCEHDHGETCNTEPKQSEDIRILLVDVVDKRLVLESSTCRYLALSYVWGGVSMLRTLKSNLQKYSVVASLDPQNPDIPKTISDAMYLVLALGERYLWVDSLCIVQDDTKQKHYYISRMDVIYSKAFATIGALSGKDANAGLPGIRPGSRRPQMIEHTATLSLVSTPPNAGIHSRYIGLECPCLDFPGKTTFT